MMPQAGLALYLPLRAQPLAQRQTASSLPGSLLRLSCLRSSNPGGTGPFPPPSSEPWIRRFPPLSGPAAVPSLTPIGSVHPRSSQAVAVGAARGGGGVGVRLLWMRRWPRRGVRAGENVSCLHLLPLSPLCNGCLCFSSVSRCFSHICRIHISAIRILHPRICAQCYFSLLEQDTLRPSTVPLKCPGPFPPSGIWP